MINKENVLESLKTVIDPELFLNIVDLGLVYDVEIKKENVLVTMTLTSPGCPLSFIFEEEVPKAIKVNKDIKNVEINLVWDPPWSPDNLSDDQLELLGLIR